MGETVLTRGNLEINSKENQVIVSVNPQVCPLDIVLSSAYIFTDTCYVLIDGEPNEEILVKLIPKNTQADLEKIGRDFNNELVSYATYAINTARSQEIREAILKRVVLTNS